VKEESVPSYGSNELGDCGEFDVYMQDQSILELLIDRLLAKCFRGHAKEKV